MENQFFLDAPMSTWQSFTSSMEIQPTELNSTDYGVRFESAFSSMASSPAASNSNLSNDNFMMRELIGKLGSITNSGEISPQPLMYGNNNNNNTSCYSTPLNSPPKLNLPPLMVKEKLPSLGKSMRMNSSVADFSADPGFAARATKFSCFGSRSFNDRTWTSQLGINNNVNKMSGGFRSNNPLSSRGKIARVSSSPSLKAMLIDRSELANSQEESSNTNGDPKASRKRKTLSKDKTNSAKASEESNEKRCKSTEINGNQNNSVKAEEEDAKRNENTKPPEPPKDYIHVRARRGQATDSHSLAERVRREKISERMKLLQNLVPGCNKVTGKALMLDEIINYVQSLQRQVEFLSMKLASVNTSPDFNVNSLTPKDVNNSLPHQIFPIESSASPIFGQQNPTVHGNGNGNISNGTVTQCLVDRPLDTAIRPNLNNHLPPIHQFTQTVPQYQTFREGDLQTIVEMGFGQNLSREMALLSENFQGSDQVSHMKVEL